MRSTKTILLVEDNPDDADLTIGAFRKHPLANELVLARDGVEALDYLVGTGKWEGRDVSQQPEVILLDLNLPRIDGLEVLRRIRADGRTRLLPVVILTSSKEERDLSGSYGLGANSYVQKPVDFNEFVETARQLSVYWTQVNEPPPGTGHSLTSDT